MAYTTIDKPSDYFNTKLYTGSDGTSAISGVGFQSDWTWIKCRSNGGSASFEHVLTDAVRGVNKTLVSNDTDAETTNNATGYLSVFGTDGFTVTGGDAVNGVGRTYASWNWKAGTSFTNDASATGIGSIDSTGSVNTDAGFSIVKWTVGGGVNGLAVAHSLGVAPKIIIYKRINSTGDWYVWLNKVIDSSQDYLVLNNTSAKADINSGTYGIPSSTLISNFGFANIEMIAYCFAEKKGYSKFGSYTGNGNVDGPFVYTGFKPAMLIIKNSSAGSTNWTIIDNKMNPSNQMNIRLTPNSNEAEQVNSNPKDFLSNGFKLRTTGSYENGSGNNYIYMAFAENPFVTSTAVPATAR